MTYNRALVVVLVVIVLAAVWRLWQVRFHQKVGVHIGSAFGRKVRSEGT